jgi:hypothetical protein
VPLHDCCASGDDASRVVFVAACDVRVDVVRSPSSIRSTHSQVLSEVQFCNTFARCCITGLMAVPGLQDSLPSADAKLGALLPRLGFGSRRDLLAFLHAKANGEGGKGSGGAAAVAALLREHGVDVATLGVGHHHGHGHGHGHGVGPLGAIARPNRGASLPTLPSSGGGHPSGGGGAGSRAGTGTKDPSVPPSRQVDGYMLPHL